MTDDDALRADVLDLLTDALQWRLAEARWSAVRTAVDVLAAALRDGDAEAVQTAVAELELLGPVRAAPIGDEPILPAPRPVRDEIDRLVRALAPEPGSSVPAPGGSRGDVTPRARPATG